jgi:hypothetical protein
MRRVRKALREAGIAPPDPVQKVQLQRETGAEPHAAESATSRDTSVDHALDAQVGHARAVEEGADLLDAPPPADRQP